MHYDPGYFDLEQKTLQLLDNPFGPRLSPMSQVRSVTEISGPDKGSLAERVELRSNLLRVGPPVALKRKCKGTAPRGGALRWLVCRAPIDPTLLHYLWLISH